jgi:hypothetical protein
MRRIRRKRWVARVKSRERTLGWLVRRGRFLRALEAGARLGTAEAELEIELQRPAWKLAHRALQWHALLRWMGHEFGRPHFVTDSSHCLGSAPFRTPGATRLPFTVWSPWPSRGNSSRGFAASCGLGGTCTRLHTSRTRFGSSHVVIARWRSEVSLRLRTSELSCSWTTNQTSDF